MDPYSSKISAAVVDLRGGLAYQFKFMNFFYKTI